MENRTPKSSRGQRTWGQPSASAHFPGLCHEVTFPSQHKWQNSLLQTSTAQPRATGRDGISQENLDYSSSGKPVTSYKVQKFLTRAELLPQPRAGTLKTGGPVSKSLSVLFSCIIQPKKTYLSLQLPPWKWKSFIKEDFSLSYLDLFCLILLFHCDFYTFRGESHRLILNSS